MRVCLTGAAGPPHVPPVALDNLPWPWRGLSRPYYWRHDPSFNSLYHTCDKRAMFKQHFSASSRERTKERRSRCWMLRPITCFLRQGLFPACVKVMEQIPSRRPWPCPIAAGIQGEVGPGTRSSGAHSGLTGPAPHPVPIRLPSPLVFQGLLFSAFLRCADRLLC